MFFRSTFLFLFACLLIGAFCGCKSFRKKEKNEEFKTVLIISFILLLSIQWKFYAMFVHLLRYCKANCF